MSNLSEEEKLIEYLQSLDITRIFYDNPPHDNYVGIGKAIQGLLDLYQKEKEKNKDIEATLKQTQDSWYEDTKKIELNNECEIALNNRIIDLENELNKEKEKNKGYQELLKQNEFRRKIETCMTHNMPKNAEIICMIREDFERNFGNDYINKDKIREKIEELEEKIHVVTPDTHIIDKITEFKNEGALNILQELLEEE